MLETGSHCEIAEQFQAFFRHFIFQDGARAYISDLILDIWPRLFRDFLILVALIVALNSLNTLRLIAGSSQHCPPCSLPRFLHELPSRGSFQGTWQRWDSASENSLMMPRWCSRSTCRPPATADGNLADCHRTLTLVGHVCLFSFPLGEAHSGLALGWAYGLGALEQACGCRGRSPGWLGWTVPEGQVMWRSVGPRLNKGLNQEGDLGVGLEAKPRIEDVEDRANVPRVGSVSGACPWNVGQPSWSKAKPKV